MDNHAWPADSHRQPPAGETSWSAGGGNRDGWLEGHDPREWHNPHPHDPHRQNPPRARPEPYREPEPYGQQQPYEPYGWPAQGYPSDDPYPATYPSYAGRARLPDRAANGTPAPGPGPPNDPPAEPDNDPAWLATLTWTVGCFLVPVTLYLVWAATRSGTPPPGCVDDAGATCPAPRAETLQALVDTAPGLFGAVTLALVAAVGLRLLIETWRASTVGLAAAVIGAGAATAIATALG